MKSKSKLISAGVAVSVGALSWAVLTGEPLQNVDSSHQPVATYQSDLRTEQDADSHAGHRVADSQSKSTLSKQGSAGNDIQGKAEQLKALIANYRGPSLNIDVNGDLIVDNALKRYMEHLTHFLGIEGAVKEEVYRLSLEQIQQLFSGDLLVQVTEQFERFWQYNAELNTLMSAEDIADAKAEFDGTYERDNTVALLDRYQDARSELRNDYFNANEIEAYFGDENRYDAFYKQSLIDGHSRNAERLLSESQRDYRKKSHVLVNIKALEQNANLVPGSQSWKDRVRSEYDKEMADKIILAQKKKTEWHDKKNEYLSRRDALEQQTSLSSTDLAHELDRIMRDELAFSEFEVRRIQALEGRFQQKI